MLMRVICSFGCRLASYMRIGSSFVFYLGFVKFYRHHTLENLMSITVDPNLRENLQVGTLGCA